ncbi:MAG: DUF420 domain-containing protein [Acidobacteriota bacterium]
MIVSVASLPLIDACLNATSAILLLAGRRFIRQGHIAAHRACMISAVVTSTAFLACYLTYHALEGSTAFTGTGWTRPAYFTLLISHTLLAAAVPPLVLWTLVRAVRRRFAAHRALARWTFPIWLYVSVTGVTIYLALYTFGGNAG